jgi:RNA polymerase sigma factor (sigma-70 family)
MTPEQLFLANLPLVKELVAQACRRCYLKRETAEDFLSDVLDRIMADEYAVLRKFEGKSRLKRYLHVVISRYMFDFQNHLWGKWRPSEMAKRLGPVAVQLDTLLHRNGHSFDEAVQILRTNHKVEMSWQELNEIAAKLPPRTPRNHMEGEEILESLPSSENQPDAGIIEEEKSIRLARALEVLRKALKSLPAEDHVILRMHLWDRFSITQISKVLGLVHKPLYGRIQKIKKHLREEMERQGIRKEDIQDLFDE